MSVYGIMVDGQTGSEHLYKCRKVMCQIRPHYFLSCNYIPFRCHLDRAGERVVALARWHVIMAHTQCLGDLCLVRHCTF